MGLDMYLSRVPKCNSIEELEQINSRLDEAYYKNELASELTKIHKEKELIYNIPFSIEKWIDIEKWKDDKENWGHLIYLHIRMAYWRKFNALHDWMVQNVQNGEDDCETYIVTEDHLIKLKTDLNEINEENCGEKLPTKSGFFFGNTDYDEWYWENVKNLKSTVDYLLTQQEHATMYIYSSSW